MKNRLKVVTLNMAMVLLLTTTLQANKAEEPSVQVSNSDIAEYIKYYPAIKQMVKEIMPYLQKVSIFMDCLESMNLSKI